jgi:hypothetical protein
MLPMLIPVLPLISLTLVPELRRERMVEIMVEDSGFMMVGRQVEDLFAHIYNQN